MISPTPTLTEKPLRCEIFVTVAGVDYCVEVVPTPGRDYDYVYVNVKRDVPAAKWWRMEFSEWTEAPCNDFDAIRYSFRKIRGKMNRLVWDRQTFLNSARQETGGKRGYYTRLANDCRKSLLIHAAEWRLCKALWKEITKL